LEDHKYDISILLSKMTFHALCLFTLCCFLRLDKLYPETSSNSSDGINFWEGRKIIPFDKWLKITRANTISNSRDYNVKEGLQYFPDDYFAWMFPLGIPIVRLHMKI
jgi:hypothetical protein